MKNKAQPTLNNLNMSILKTLDSDYGEYITILCVQDERAVICKYLTMEEYGQMISGIHDIKLRNEPPK